MKKKNRLGLKEILLTTGLTLASILPGKAQEPSPQWAAWNVYNQPNTQELIGKNKLDWYGSGDVNNDEAINYQDYVDMDLIANDRSDIDGDGNPSTENDKQILKNYLDGNKNYLPAHWNKLNKEEKMDWLDKCLAVDKTDTITVVPYYFDCDEFARNLRVNFSGFANFENSPYSSIHENTTTNARFNIPMLDLRIRGPPYNHSINAVYVGDGKENSLLENLIDDLVYIEGETDDIRNPRDYIPITETSKQQIYWEGYLTGIHSRTGERYEEFIDEQLIDWRLVNGEAELYSKAGDLILFDPTKYDTLTFEGVPENKIFNYGKDISSYLEEEISDVNSTLPMLSREPFEDYYIDSVDYKNSEKIPLSEDHPDIHYKIIRKVKASTPFMTDSTSWEIEVKDIESPKINNFPEDNSKQYSASLNPDEINPDDLEIQDNSGLEVVVEKSTESTQLMNGTIDQVNFDFYTDVVVRDKFDNDTTYTHKTEVRDTQGPEAYLSDTYVRRESNQIAEDAVKSLVEEVYDNSELPVDTIVEQTGDKYYDVFLKDVAGNETYLGNVEVDNSVGIEDEPSSLEKTLKAYPNPVLNDVYVNYNTNRPENMNVEIYDLSGRLIEIYNENLSAGEGKATFDLSELNTGMYLMNITVGDRTKTTKILKK